MELELRDLRVFLAVEEAGSFGRAATALLVTQPAVSERVRNLERIVGQRLFVRTARGSALTPAGERILPYARRSVTLANETIEALRVAPGVERFVVAVHSNFAPKVVPLVMRALGTLPRRFAVRDVHSEAVGPLLLDGSAHVGFAIPAPIPRSLRRVGLRPDPVVCLVVADHPLTGVRRPTPADLREHLIAMNAWGSGADRFAARLREAGVEDWRVRLIADATTAMTLAREEHHVAFVARSTVPPGGDLRAIELAGLSSWRVRLDLLYRASARDDPAVRAVVGAVRAV